VLTKVLQRPRLAAYLEQSTRYIPYDAPMPGGGYRYWRDPELGPRYGRAMDALFDVYSNALPKVTAWADEQFPPPNGEPSAAHRRAIQAKALDLLRGLLPAASLSHMGIYASGQTYEQLILHLLAHPLPEARAYGRMILDAVKAVIPSFVTRVPTAAASGSPTSRRASARPSAGSRAWGSTAPPPPPSRPARPSASCTSTATRTRSSARCCSRRRARARRRRASA
jgi:thymidylate synthase ThyX